LGEFVKRFRKLFFKIYCELLGQVSASYSAVRSAYHFTQSAYFLYFLKVGRPWISWPSPPDMIIIPHPPLDCNRQNTQNREILHINVCAVCQLTFCVAGCIMEIRP
jgi:hypothetical protein